MILKERLWQSRAKIRCLWLEYKGTQLNHRRLKVKQTFLPWLLSKLYTFVPEFDLFVKKLHQEFQRVAKAIISRLSSSCGFPLSTATFSTTSK